MKTDEFKELVKLADKRLKALIEFDIDYGQSVMPECTREVVILGMHKARYLCPDVPAELRHASAKFLRDGGHKSNGKDILPEGQLP